MAVVALEVGIRVRVIAVVYRSWDCAKRCNVGVGDGATEYDEVTIGVGARVEGVVVVVL